MKQSLVLITLVFILSACSNIQTRRGKVGSTPDGPFDSDNQTDQTYQTDENQNVEETPRQRIKPKIAVVLGPGAFKTFAYPSFLKTLSQSGVQVDEIIGIEWGALSAAFYANNGKPHEAEWKVFKLKKEDLDDSSMFSNSKTTKVTSFRKYLKTNLGEKAMSKTEIPFHCPILRVNRGTVDWGKQGALWRRVEICMASAPRFQPIDDSIPSLFSIDQVAKNLKRKGYGIVIFVNVLGSPNTDSWASEDWVTRAYWSEARRHIWKAKAEYTDIFEIDTGKYEPFDFKAKTGLKGVGERAGKAAARKLVEKYKL